MRPKVGEVWSRICNPIGHAVFDTCLWDKVVIVDKKSDILIDKPLVYFMSMVGDWVAVPLHIFIVNYGKVE